MFFEYKKAENMQKMNKNLHIFSLFTIRDIKQKLPVSLCVISHKHMALYIQIDRQIRILRGKVINVLRWIIGKANYCITRKMVNECYIIH